MAKKKRRFPFRPDDRNKPVKDKVSKSPETEDLEIKDSPEQGSSGPAQAVKESEAAEAVETVEAADAEEAVEAAEPAETVTEEASEISQEIKDSTESNTVEEEKDTMPGQAHDAMPEFLKSANSTIRRDGPYANYKGNADILRHTRREPENARSRRLRKKKQRQRREGLISTETISLIALVIILGAIFFCAVKHIELTELSISALIVISVITIVMGALVGDIPSYVTLILVALIIIAGAITGMLSEVLTGLILFLSTVLAIKGRFD